MADPKPKILKDQFAALCNEEKLLQAVTEAEKGNDIPFYMIHLMPLPQNSYSWLYMLKKRYPDHFDMFALSVLESGTTMADFEDTRHFRAWYTASLKGKSREVDDNGRVVNLEMWK